jgi:selenocysteine-specific elongation factor
VTGTAISGQVRVGDMVMIYPPRFKARIRNIQVHSENVEATGAGARTAINLQGIDKLDLERGMVVATPEALLPSLRLDGRLELLPSAPRPLKNRRQVRLHTGTSEYPALVTILSQDELAPGESGYVQFRLAEPLALKPGDRFVIRAFSPALTLGGGQILHIHPPKHKRFQEDVLKGLDRLETGSADEQILFYFHEAGPAGLSDLELLQLVNLNASALSGLLQKLTKEGQIRAYDPENLRYVLTAQARTLQDQMLNHLQKFHQAQPLQMGLSKEELRRKLPAEVEVRLFNYLLQDLEQKGKSATERDLVRLTSHRIVLAQDQENLVRRLEDLYRQGGLMPVTLKETQATMKVDAPRLQDLMRLLVAQGRLVKVKEDLFFHQEVMANLKNILVAYLRDHGQITVPQFKDLTQTSRKYTIPLLEYFDATRVTVRVGEHRRLREVG